MTAHTMQKRTVFFVSDETGVTAETLGRGLLTQFDRLDFRPVTVPFVSTPEKARETVRAIDRAAQEDGQRPLVFSTLVHDEVREVIGGANGFCVDLFDTFIEPLETELDLPSAHAIGLAHGMSDTTTYYQRIEATNFALAHDDGVRPWEYAESDVVLVGVSRSGKTPTSLYLALQYGIFAANSPLTEEYCRDRRLPDSLLGHRDKLYGLTLTFDRLLQIRRERLPGTRYASPEQIRFELDAAAELFDKYEIPCIDTTQSSVEEIASTILNRTGLQRRSWG
jgi:regulator of PEP synthase PpsR (kinase-PPPase family)